jgi:hypothetical protein
MEVLKFREVDGNPAALLIVENIDRLRTEPVEVMALASLLEPESARRLLGERTHYPTHQDWMSECIKRGMRAAKERRKKEQ